MSSYNPFPNPSDWEDENLSDDEREDRFYEEWDKARERFDPADWVNGRIDRATLEYHDLSDLRDWFIEKIVDSDFEFPPALTERLEYWPPACALSEEELRTEVQGLLAMVKALRRKAEALSIQAPEDLDQESCEWVPPGKYSALGGAVSSVIDSDLKYTEAHLEEALAGNLERSTLRWFSDFTKGDERERIKAEIRRRWPQEDE